MAYPKFLVILLLIAFPQMASATDHPNIVWLTSEDKSVHYLNLFWSGGAATPNIEKLARHGLIFDHAFSNAPVCSVARSTLLTGSYAPRIGAQYHRWERLAPMPVGARMYPWYLRQEGYYTSNNSKTDYNVIVSDGWDDSSTKASWRNRQPGQPFFHVQNIMITHESSLHFTAREMDKVKNKTHSESAKLFPYFPHTPTFQYTYDRYLDIQTKMDSQLGDYINMLEADGLIDDTFIFYYGDHGGALPRGKGYVYESGLHVPFVVYVPKNWKHLVDAEFGTRVQGFVSFVDFAPTLLHLAGVDVPNYMDGKPFLGEGISINEVNTRDEAFGYADRMDEKYDLVRSLRKGKFKYIRSYQPFNFDGLWNGYRYRMLAYQEWWQLFQANKLNAIQRQFFEPRMAEALFDLEEDPHEIGNLMGNPAYSDVLRDMRQRLTSKVKSLPDLSFIPESVLVTEAFDNPVQFGQNNKGRISRLVDVANLSLLKFDEARVGIRNALNSKDSWERYWGLIVCSSFGDAARPFIEKSRIIAANDPENLVRLRAAEFLGLINSDDPAPVILKSLYNARSEVEANLILNTVVLLQDLRGYDFDIDVDMLDPIWKEDGTNLSRRLKYLIH